MPPLVGVAVNVTEVPAQIVVNEAATETDGVTTGFTVMVIALDVAVVGEAQEAVEVITHVIIFPLAKAAEVYVELVAPEILLPFSFH